MTHSMTGFASLKGEAAGFSWLWDIRAVNGRGLDIRLRLPDWIPGLESELRKALAGAISRGNVSLSLKVSREAAEAAQTLNPEALDHALAILAEITARAAARGIAVTAPDAAQVAAMRGVIGAGAAEVDTGPLVKALLAQLPELLAAFNQMRAQEGAALAALLAAQLDQMQELIEAARQAAAARAGEQAQLLRANLARVMDNTDGADPDRVAQELALIAVKSDITEEIDRLSGHVEAARALLAGDGPRGRKLDFLMQEFNREANTLCAKAQFQDLTRIGLDMKHVVDQMREQVQNVE